MTVASLEAARARKRELAIERDEQARHDIADYRGWLVQEREAFQHRKRLAETVGRDDLEYIIADICWREVWLSKPDVPPDSVWRRLRGEEPLEDEDV